MRDFFPKRRDVQEDGIHAKLNYQNIADAQRRSMSLLMLLIIAFSIGFVLSIYKLSITETMVSEDDFNNTLNPLIHSVNPFQIVGKIDFGVRRGL